jgi:hypothetical protein
MRSSNTFFGGSKFAALHMSARGTKLPILNVRSSVANGVKRTRYAQCEFFAFRPIPVPQPSRNPALQRAPNALQNGTSLLGRPPGMPVTSRGAHAGFQMATHCDKDFSTLSTERVDRAHWRHTIRIVHRHRRAFQRGRRGATLRKGRSMMGQARQCTCAEGQRTGRSIDRSEPCHGWLLMR